MNAAQQFIKKNDAWLRDSLHSHHTKDTQLTIYLLHLDEKKFPKVIDFMPMKSPLKDLLKYTNKDPDLENEDEHMVVEVITGAIKRNRDFPSFYNPTKLFYFQVALLEIVEFIWFVIK